MNISTRQKTGVLYTRNGCYRGSESDKRPLFFRKKRHLLSPFTRLVVGGPYPPFSLPRAARQAFLMWATSHIRKILDTTVEFLSVAVRIEESVRREGAQGRILGTCADSSGNASDDSWIIARLTAEFGPIGNPESQTAVHRSNPPSAASQHSECSSPSRPTVHGNHPFACRFVGRTSSKPVSEKNRTRAHLPFR